MSLISPDDDSETAIAQYTVLLGGMSSEEVLEQFAKYTRQATTAGWGSNRDDYRTCADLARVELLRRLRVVRTVGI